MQSALSKRGISMVQKLNDRGICDTCIYRSDCLSLKNSMKEGRSVLYCEEFDTSATKKEGESLRLSNTFTTLPSFSIKNLIPGWES